MAENKREEWEVERDRDEIATLLARYRRMTHKRIAEILNQRREEEYRQALANLGELPSGQPIPAINPPYTLTRQMIDYDVKAIERRLIKHSTEKFEKHFARQLAAAEELHDTAWADYERTKKVADELVEEKSQVDVTTSVEEFFEDDREASEIIFNRRGKKRFKVPALKTKSKRKRKQLLGDPRFLLVVDRAQTRIENLLKLVGPQEINLNLPPTTLVEGFDPKQWDKAAKDKEEADTRAREDSTDASQA